MIEGQDDEIRATLATLPFRTKLRWLRSDLSRSIRRPFREIAARREAGRHRIGIQRRAERLNNERRP